jgi:hypothetical protein
MVLDGAELLASRSIPIYPPEYLPNKHRICIANIVDNSTKFLTSKNVIIYNKTKLRTNSVDLVRERTIPTERPQLFGEVIANFGG